jgi:hypothetical protein
VQGRGSPPIRQELDRIVRSLKAFVESAIALIFPSATTPPNANLIEHTPRQPILAYMDPSGEWRRDCNEERALMKRSATSLPTLVELPVESHGS